MLGHPGFQLALAGARAGASAVLDLDPLGLERALKQDFSPVTAADLNSQQAIHQILEPFGLEIVSEEGDGAAAQGEEYWLIDPLDGTKDFLNGSSDFTVNIALISRGSVVFGVVAAPATDTVFVGGKGLGCHVIHKGKAERVAPKRHAGPVRVVTSRTHEDKIFDEFCSLNAVSGIARVGSSLKYCLVARNIADLAPRFIGSSEWDTAAAQGVVEGAGGSVVDLVTRQTLTYGKPSHRNPPFVALRAGYSLEEFVFPSFDLKEIR